MRTVLPPPTLEPSKTFGVYIRMMNDRRHTQRQFVLRAGKLIIPDGDSVVECEILNFSESGAGLIVPKDVALPPCFTLHDVGTDRRYATRVKWRRGKRVGVAFDDLADYDE